jgi:hypothetical protein
MTRSALTAATAVLAMIAFPSGLASHASDPFGVLAPDIAVGLDERQRLQRGETVVRVLPGRDGYLALSAIVKVEATAARVVAWTSQVEKLQKGKYVPEVGRFSTPPHLRDLDGLTIEPGDLVALRRCRPGDCDVKLSDVEIDRLRSAGDAGLETAFRQILIERATNYLRDGDSSALPYRDHKMPVAPAEAFQAVLHRLTFFPRQFDCYAAYLRGFPNIADRHVQESFLYWSKETLGMKPIVSITHFSADWFDTPDRPEAMVVSKQVYATHYRNAAITMNVVVADGASHYLVYINRSQIDAFKGMFGGFVRRVVERRVLAEAPDVLRGIRRRIEAAPPDPMRQIDRDTHARTIPD